MRVGGRGEKVREGEGEKREGERGEGGKEGEDSHVIGIL